MNYHPEPCMAGHYVDERPEVCTLDRGHRCPHRDRYGTEFPYDIVAARKLIKEKEPS